MLKIKINLKSILHVEKEMGDTVREFYLNQENDK